MCKLINLWGFTDMKLLFTFLLFLILLPGASAVGDEVQINEMLKSGSYVALEPKIYTISDLIVLDSGNALEGESGTIIRLFDRTGWTDWKSLLSAINFNNVEVCN